MNRMGMQLLIDSVLRLIVNSKCLEKIPKINNKTGINILIRPNSKKIEIVYEEYDKEIDKNIYCIREFDFEKLQNILGDKSPYPKKNMDIIICNNLIKVKIYYNEDFIKSKVFYIKDIKEDMNNFLIKFKNKYNLNFDISVELVISI